MAETDGSELAQLADLVRVRNAIEVCIARLLDRPTSVGGMGEWIAARIFDIELEAAANVAGYDGRFMTGPLQGKTVNIKTYTKYEQMLDINLNAPLDYYLVFTGPKAAAVSSRGTIRPFGIERVFLFDAERLHAELAQRGVKVGIATSVRAAQWDAGEIYPRSNNPLLPASELQRRQLKMFACG
jgi:hypothetical protein